MFGGQSEEKIHNLITSYVTNIQSLKQHETPSAEAKFSLCPVKVAVVKWF